MDIHQALIAFDALSQETRLRAFRLLVEQGPDGLPAGQISEQLGLPHNTLSFHLNHMSHAGLVISRRDGRSIIYSANFDLFAGLLRFMVEDCCRKEFASVREDRKKNTAIIELMGCCPAPKQRKRS